MTDGLTDKDRAGIRAALEACPKVRRAVLFGSRALGTFRGASDVDLALEGDDIRLADLVAIKAKVAKVNIPVEVDLVIRAKIDNPDVEKHIQDFGREWYRRGWREMTLGDFVTIQRGHDLTEPERRPGRVPVMGSAGQNGFHDTALAKGPGIVIGRSVASFGQVHFAKEDFWPHNTGLYVTDFKGNDPLFAFYFLKALDFDRFNSGSAQPSLNRNFIYPIPIRVPKPAEQKAIAAVLGALDDKIELNRRMNATLEAMARALFQSWFVDFDPVRAKLDGRPPAALDPATASLFPEHLEETALGHTPKGWEVRSLDKTAHYLNGLALQKYPPGDGPTLPVIKIAQLRKGDSIGADRCNTDLPPNYVVQDGDVLFSWSGSLEVELWCGGPGALNQHLFKVTSPEFPKWFYYLWTLHHLDEFRLIAADKATTMGHIQRGHLTAAKVLIPPRPLLDAMTRTMSPLIDQLIANRTQSRTLATLRDTLLPKLLSGELSVGECAAS